MFYYKKKDMYIFDNNEKFEAHNTSVTDYLTSNYGLTFKKDGRGYRCREHNSLFVNNDDKSWYWNSRSVGGGDIIAFVQKFDDMLNLRPCELEYSEALKIILKPNTSESTTYVSNYKKAPKVAKDEVRELKLPPKKEGKFNRLFAYLVKTRKLDKDIVSCLCHKKYLYEDTKGNIVFLGRDKNKNIKYATVRGTLTDKQYRKDCYGSDKANGFYLNGYDKTTLYVFEAPIDLLSHATMCNMAADDNKAWLNNCRLSLAGVSDNALEHYLQEYKSVENLVFCLDNDKAGKDATSKFMDKYSALGYKCSSEPAAYGKDYNEELQHLKANAVTPILK